MRPVKTALFAVALLVIATVALPAARADTTTFVPTSVASSPGTLVGTTDALARVDASRVTWTETDTTGGSYTTWLKPNGDSAVQWKKSPNPVGAHYLTQVEVPPNDDNASYVSANALASELYNLEDWGSRPTDITITSVTGWMWSRKNQSTDPGVQATVFVPDTPDTGCVPSFAGTLSLAFTNYTFGPYATSCLGGSWTIAALNSVYISFLHPNNVQAVAMTSDGVSVAFTRHDYAVDAYVNFTGLTGTTPVLSYTGSQSLPGGETAALQVNRAGVWTTVVTPFLGAVEASAQYAMDPALDVSAGTASFRIVDNTPTDQTGGTLALDQFVITTTTVPGGGGGGILGALRLDCVPQFFATVACTATLSSLAIGVSIIGSSWYVDGRYEKEGSGGARSRSAVLDAFVFPAGTVNVTVRLSFDNGQIVYLSKEVRLDNSWILLLVLLAVVAFIVAALALYARKHGKKGKSKEQTWDEEYGFWGGVFK